MNDTNKIFTNRVEILEKQINRNSNNSSKHPSINGFKKKTKSLRVKSDKKVGGQIGYIGNTLELKENPDEILTYTIENCDICGRSLKSIPVDVLSYIKLLISLR